MKVCIVQRISTAICLSLCLVWASYQVSAQVVNIGCQFETDTFALGKPVVLICNVEKVVGTKVVLPNYSAAYSPFEWERTVKKIPRRKDSIVLDKYWIYLKTFELDSVQSTTFPLAWITDGDTFYIEAATDSITLNHRIKGDLSQYQYRQDRSLLYVETPPDYMKMALWVLLIISTGTGVFYVIRKPLNTWWILQKLKKRWDHVRNQVNKLEIEATDQASYFKQLNTLWKTYLDPDGDLALASSTTTELPQALAHFPFLNEEENNWLIEVSENSDQVIHAGRELKPSIIHHTTRDMNQVLYKVYLRKRKALRQVS